MYFGKRRDKLCELRLNCSHIQWTEKWKYLGIDLVSHNRFNCCVEEKLRKFYRCLNAILRVEGKSNDMIMLQLLEAHAVSILTYGIEVIFVADRDKRRQLRVAYNSVFRRVFDYQKFESVSNLQSFLDRPTWEVLVERRNHTFESNIRSDTFLSNLFPI